MVPLVPEGAVGPGRCSRSMEEPALCCYCLQGGRDASTEPWG